MVKNLVGKPGNHKLAESRTTNESIRRIDQKQKKPNGKLETAERKIGRILGALGKFEKWH